MMSSNELLLIEEDYSPSTGFTFNPERLVITSAQKTYSIGRAPDKRDLRIYNSSSDAIPGEPKISDRHATIRVEDNNLVTLSNASSGRSVYLNGVEISLGDEKERYVIHPGDKIHLILTEDHKYETKNVGNEPNIALRVSPPYDPSISPSIINRIAGPQPLEFKIDGDEIELRGIGLDQWPALRQLLEQDPYHQASWIKPEVFKDIAQLTPTEALIVNALYQRTIFENNPKQFSEKPETVFNWQSIAALIGKKLIHEKDITDFAVGKKDDPELSQEEFDSKIDAESDDSEEESYRKLHEYQSHRLQENEKVKKSVEEHIRVIRKKIDRNYLMRGKGKREQLDYFLIRTSPLGYSMPAIKYFK